MLLVTNEPNADGTPSNSRYTGRQWHSDRSFTLIPSLGSLLKSWTVPEVGGDTLFENMTLAYDTLSEGMKNLIADLHGIQLAGTRKINHAPTGVERAEQRRKLNPPVAQPVVRVHPETGRSGKLRVLGITTAGRSAAWPEIPTVAEAGITGYASIAWYGLVASAGLAPAVLDKLSAEVINATRAKDMQDTLIKQGAEPVGNSPRNFLRSLNLKPSNTHA